MLNKLIKVKVGWLEKVREAWMSFRRRGLGGTNCAEGTFSGFQGRQYGLSWRVDAA